MFSNFVLSYLKLLAFAALLEILEMFLCLLLFPHTEVVTLQMNISSKYRSKKY
jgi:hypothetical protein